MELEARRRVTVRGIMYKDGKIFAQKFKHAKEIFWGTPGGGVDSHESLLGALKREMIEETGVEPVVGKLLFVQQYPTTEIHHGTDEHLEFFFHITNADDYHEIDLESTTHGTIEIEHCEFINPRKENILPEFLQTIDIESYIAGDKSVYFYDEF